MINNQNYIQSSVNITNGNSGGPLINKYGKVIGITSAGISLNDIDYMNLSIPINELISIDRTMNYSLFQVNQIENEVVLSYYKDNTLLTKISCQRGDIVSPLLEPLSWTNEGMDLYYWATNPTLWTPFDFSKPIENDVSVYGRWTMSKSAFSLALANYCKSNGKWSTEITDDDGTIYQHTGELSCENNVITYKRTRKIIYNTVSSGCIFTNTFESIITFSFIIGQYYTDLGITNAVYIVTSQSSGNNISYDYFIASYSASNIDAKNREATFTNTNYSSTFANDNSLSLIENGKADISSMFEISLLSFILDLEKTEISDYERILVWQ